MTHYVRTGDFVEALLKDSRNINEYAFALGALSHYVADNTGRPLAINLSKRFELRTLWRMIRGAK
ncbi:MAG TPA: zinc dependent phospholipase C family protein [Terriglobia bacterium]|nr:zinc dependent phospholipase C family protein [Terriglobia bacterium]